MQPIYFKSYLSISFLHFRVKYKHFMHYLISHVIIFLHLLPILLKRIDSISFTQGVLMLTMLLAYFIQHGMLQPNVCLTLQMTWQLFVIQWLNQSETVTNSWISCLGQWLIYLRHMFSVEYQWVLGCLNFNINCSIL